MTLAVWKRTWLFDSLYDSAVFWRRDPMRRPISDIGISRLRSADPFRDPKLSATMPPIGLGGGVVALGGTALAWFAMAFSHGIN